MFAHKAQRIAIEIQEKDSLIQQLSRNTEGYKVAALKFCIVIKILKVGKFIYSK